MSFMEIISDGASKALAFGQKHSPEILAITGTVGVIAGTVMACKATTKLSQIKKQHEEEMKAIREYEVSEEYTEEDKRKDTVITYTRTALSLAKTYAPAAGMIVLSLGCLLSSNNILRKRNAALTAAYTTVYTAFKEYRARVVDRFGEDVDHQLRYNIKPQEITETKTDEKGKEKTTKTKVETSDGVESGYARYFTRSNDNWDGGDDIYVQNFFQMKQQYLNDRLKSNPYKFMCLNDVYGELGFEKTKAGMVVGWIYDPKHPNGDNFIEITVHKVYIPGEFGELEKAFLIDFNVDGEIYTKLP